MRKPELLDVKVETVPDEDPDLSYLENEYDSLSQTVVTSCRASQADVEKYGWETVKGWLDKDAERLASYGRAWGMLGVQATGELHIPHDSWTSKGTDRGWIIQTLTTPGLWGVESDSDQSYLDEVGAEEVETLWGMAEALGCVREKVETARASYHDEGE